ncbi:uncharacterized protein RHOBADRAFT_53483 [Rhodotorula graminis WP1]|uniref:RTR1-type domain-containing protein n=1 Tax=Rhodotorula graminis (strain WP1) TaxID=578459 RepID=A0A194S459_RHOGW|nr:uncharacterized protein RHOBADRAFT_53483 [Rhodotorula graminis WP1]KPV75513.1 hypothetical protein RHOBADRAFT_53483 [Rhodotorula graminis WP1]
MPALPRVSKYTGNNPAAFHVATSTTPRSSESDASLLDSFSSSVAARFASHTYHLPSSSTDPSAPSLASSSTAATLSATLSQLDLIERLSSGPTPLDVLRRSATELDSASYADLLAERHAAGLCPYAACGNAASEPYDDGAAGAGAGAGAGAAARVRLRGGSLVRRGGAGDEADRGAYCSRRCRARSEHLAGEVARRRPGALDAPPGPATSAGAGAVELLEDVERRREDVRRSTAALLQGARAAGADLAMPIPSPSAARATGDAVPASAPAVTGAADGEARGAHGLPAPRFVSAPVMLDATSGAALEWAGVGNDGMDEGMTDEERGWMREALAVRDEARQRGEVE